MMSNKAILMVAGVALLMAGALWLRFRQPQPGSPRFGNSPVPIPPVSPVLVQHEMPQRFQTLEARREQLDRTVWAKEVLALKYEAVFVELWDQLRTQDDPFAVLEQLAFGQLALGTAGERVTVEAGIEVSQWTNQAQHLTRETWRNVLGELKRNGIRLDQSEWRHGRFEVATDDSPTSTITVTLHARDEARALRYIARGDLRVQWRKPGTPNANPFPELIEAINFEVLSRSGSIAFQHGTAAEITPESLDSKFLEPSLQLYDLDGDGLSDIILPGRNRILRNAGNAMFKAEVLFQHPPPGLQTCIIADYDGDAAADVLAVDAQGLVLIRGNQQGRFPDRGKRVWTSAQELVNPFVMTTGDIDRDGDLDLWLAQYKVPYQRGQMPTPYYDANDGYPSFLLTNDGRGNLLDRTDAAGLAAKRFRRTYSCSFADLDADDDLDLLVVSDFAGADVHLNDGHGNFADVTRTALDESHAFGMAHTFGDYDRDGGLDFLVIGMNSYVAQRLDGLNLGPTGFEESHKMRSKMGFGNRLYFRTGSNFKQTAMGEQVARSGWSWGATTGDFDNDGDQDIYVVNGHISGQSAKDYDTQFWRHDIYTGTSRDDPVLDDYFRSVRARHQAAGYSYGGLEKNRFFLNRTGKGFLEIAYLLGVAREEDCRNVVSDDLDGDGKLDLLLTTFKSWPRIQQELHLLLNAAENDAHWIGVRLRESRPGFSPIGAKVILTTASAKQFRQLVTGDSYRSQHATTAHFGLGTEDRVKSLEVVWPNGRRKTVVDPAIDRYHVIIPDQ